MDESKKKKPPISTGRKRIPINWQEVDKLLIAGANGHQIAAYVGVTPETIYERCLKEHEKAFSLYSFEKREKGNSMLLNKQFQIAMTGNVTMLIWLGKQRLGQKEPKVLNEEEIVKVINVFRGASETHQTYLEYKRSQVTAKDKPEETENPQESNNEPVG